MMKEGERTLLTPDPRADSICPFCFIGKRRVEEAIRRAKDDKLPLDFHIRFAPFLLDPTLPASPGDNKRERYTRRFGGAERVQKMEEAMIQRGLECNPPIKFSYGGVVSQTTGESSAAFAALCGVTESTESTEADNDRV